MATGIDSDGTVAIGLAWDAYRAGNRPAADSLCRAALQVDPSLAEAVYLLGVIAMDGGTPDVALAHFRHASQLRPDVATFHNALGEAYRALSKSTEAAAAFHAALAARPDYARAQLNLGLIEHTQGNLPAAAARFAQALQIDPRYATAHNALGAVYQAVGRLDGAAKHFREAIAIDPDYPEAHFNLAAILLAQRDPAAALAHLQRAIRCRPNYARAHALTGTALFELGQVAAAVASYQTAIRLRPDDADTLVRLGDALRLMGQVAEAEAALDEALRLRPGDPLAFANRFRLKAETCDWRDWAANLDRLWADALQEMQAGRPPAVHPMFTLSLPWPAARQLAVARGYARALDSRVAAPTSPMREPHPIGRRLRVGYLSRDFYDHPVAHQIQSVFGLHDRALFEVHAYSFGPNDRSAGRRRIEADCEHFHDVAALAVDQLAERIRADGIHVLIDLMGYSGFARPECLALRPAPVQVSWLGYPGTTGATFIDYLLGDPIATPATDAGAFSEAIVRLPHSYMPTDHDQPIGAAVTRAEQGLPDHSDVFCCFNNAHKIDPEIFGAWMRILSKVPGGIAWLSVREPRAQANLRREAEARGVAGDRLIFAAHVTSKADHLARLRLADLFLDTRYYNAHATACDALRAGLPVLTCPADTFASRVGASLLTAIGFPELIAPTLAEYERRAIALATDPAALLSFRERLASAKTESPLFDTARFVRNLERAYLSMWEAFTIGHMGEAIDVSE